MFIVEFHNLIDNHDVDQNLEAHKAFLAEHVKKGYIVAAGPKMPRTGGFIVAGNISREQLDAMLAQDPFLKSGSARCEIQEFKSNFLAPGLA